MQVAALILGILGVAVGLTYRLRFLVGMALMMLAITLIYVSSRSYGLPKNLLIVAAAQVLLQGGYFVGLVTRMLFSGVQRGLSGLRSPEAECMRHHSHKSVRD